MAHCVLEGSRKLTRQILEPVSTLKVYVVLRVRSVYLFYWYFS